MELIKKYFNFGDEDKSLIVKLVGLHLVIIALANYVVQFNGVIPVLDLNFTWGMFVFPLIVVATDLTVRLTNKYVARQIIAIAFIPAMIISSFIATPMIGIASGFAYAIGLMLDVSVFQRVREHLTDMWWVAPAISTVFANILDTYAFFWAGFAYGPDEFMRANWFEIASVDVVFKIIVSFVVFLPVYGLLLRELRKRITVGTGA
jgi:uncharacterized PurR-regulated membrane protein YhhQ (DUF165 family)